MVIKSQQIRISGRMLQLKYLLLLNHDYFDAIQETRLLDFFW